MGKVKVGIIGAGRIGQLHANNILQSDLFELKAIADIATEHLKNSKIWHQTPLITNESEEIFSNDEIDAVIICSSTDTHAEYIKRAANAGKHVFCEKPISFNLKETKEALEVVKEKGVKFQVGFNRRFDKHLRKVQQVVEKGGVGEPHLIKISSRDPQPPPENYIKHSGGMFMDMSIHDFDMMRYLVKSDVVDVTTKAANLIDPVFEKHGDVDTAVIIVTFESGAIGVIDNSREAVYGYDQRIEVFGNQGKVEAQNESETNVKISTRENVSSDSPKYFFLERYEDAYKFEMTEFAQSIINETDLICTGHDGYMAELLALAAKKSWEMKRTITMNEIESLI